MKTDDHVKIQQVIDHRRGEDGVLMPVLQEVQDLLGYLPEEALVKVAKGLGLPLSRIWGVVTFYGQFYLSPRGRNTIKVCQGTACHVRGSRRILDRIELVLGIKSGQTTPDLKFTLETVRCLGTCFLAPVMMINRDYFGKLRPDRIEGILNQFSGGRGIANGIEEPEGVKDLPAGTPE